MTKEIANCLDRTYNSSVPTEDVTTRYTYDKLGNVLGVTTLLGDSTFQRKEATCYDALSRPTRRVLNFTGANFPDACNPAPSGSPDQNVILDMTYDQLGLVRTYTDPNRFATAFSYDNVDRLRFVTDPLGHVADTRYDSVGNIKKQIDPLTHATDYGYDAVYRLVSATTHPNTGVDLTTTVEYGQWLGLESSPRRVYQIDPAGKRTDFEYDRLDRLVKVVENVQSPFPINTPPDLNAQTLYSYDVIGNLEAVTLPSGTVLGYGYDGLDQLKTIDGPLGADTWTLNYDRAGRPTSLLDPNGLTTDYSYDVFNRLTNINYSDTTPDVTFAYDPRGRRQNMVDTLLGTTTYGYDALDRPTIIIDPLGKTVGYGYDAGGRRTRLTLPNVGDVNYTYDAADRLTTVQDWDAGTPDVNYTYDNANRITGMTLPNGVAVSYTYDDDNRLTQVRYVQGAQTLMQYDYTLDSVGNRVSVKEQMVVADSPPPNRNMPTVAIVSIASDGAQGNGDSYQSSLSADTRYVAFQSAASNLVSGDTNADFDVFVHDRLMCRTTRASVSSGGAEGNGASYVPALSADGRYVAFQSAANNLVSGDTNARYDIFVHDRQTGQTTRVSVSSAGAQGNGDSYEPALSADDRYVAFSSEASNLVSGDTNATLDIFVHDRQTGQTTRVSVSSAGAQGNSGSYEPALSADGRYVAFQSAANNLVSGDTNARYDIFVHDRQTGQTTRVSVSSAGAQGNGDSYEPALSADGRYVAFASFTSNLISGDTNNATDIFVHDRQTGQTTRVSVSSAGAQGNGEAPALSADGRYVAFDSWASNLVSGDTNNKRDVFVAEASWSASTPLPVGTHQQNHPDIRYIGDWTTVNTASANGGSYIYSSNPSPHIYFRFEGDGLALYRIRHSARATMEVCIDGVCQTVNNVVSGATYWQQPWVINDLGFGVHEVVIRKVSGVNLDLDRVDVLGTPTPLQSGTYQETDPNLTYFNAAQWISGSDANARGGTYKYNGNPDAAITFAFNGNGLILYMNRAYNRGEMEVCIDSVCQTRNNYNASALWQQPWEFSGLTQGVHIVRIVKRSPAGIYLDLDAVEVLGSAAPLPVGAHEETHTGIRYRGVWPVYTSASASGGKSVYDTEASASVEFSFEGDGLALYRIRASNRGDLQVCIDTTNCQTVPGYVAGATVYYQQPWVINGLGFGVHTVRITKLSGTYFDVDRIDVLGTPTPLQPGTYQETNPNLTYFSTAQWSAPTSAASARGGTYKYNGSPDAAITFAFNGDGLILYHATASNGGEADVCIDGVCQRYTIYSATTQWQVPFSFTGLTPGVHIVRIVKRSPAGLYLNLDSVEVLGSAAPLPVGTHEETHTSIRYRGLWITYPYASSSAGSSVYTGDAAATASFSIEGDGLVLYRIRATNRGTMRVCIDATNCRDVSNTAGADYYQEPVVFNGLGFGVHSVTVSKVSGSYIDLDRIDVLGTPTPLPAGTHQQDHADIRYFHPARWTTQNNPSASGGSFIYTTDLDAAITFAFDGDELTLYRVTATNRGNMDVCIDTTCQVVSNYSATTQWQAPVGFTGLTPGVHNVRITKLTGTYFDLDRWRWSLAVVSARSPSTRRCWRCLLRH